MKKNLKTLAVFICAAFLLCFTQCTKPAKDLIIGTWKVVDMVITETYGDNTEIDHEDLDDDEPFTFTFNKDNTMTISKFEVENDVIHAETIFGTYSIANNKLTLVPDNEDEKPEIYDIETLTKKELVISMSQSDEIEDTPFSISIKITLKRQ